MQVNALVTFYSISIRTQKRNRHRKGSQGFSNVVVLSLFCRATRGKTGSAQRRLKSPGKDQRHVPVMCYTEGASLKEEQKSMNRRSLIRMSEDEIRTFLEEGRKLQVA